MTNHYDIIIIGTGSGGSNCGEGTEDGPRGSTEGVGGSDEFRGAQRDSGALITATDLVTPTPVVLSTRASS